MEGQERPTTGVSSATTAPIRNEVRAPIAPRRETLADMAFQDDYTCM
jgi:hypothetical protein